MVARAGLIPERAVKKKYFQGELRLYRLSGLWPYRLTGRKRPKTKIRLFGDAIIEEKGHPEAKKGEKQGRGSRVSS